MEKMVDVVALVRSNSPSIDLKKTPKERRIPQRVVPTTRKDATMTQP